MLCFGQAAQAKRGSKKVAQPQLHQVKRAGMCRFDTKRSPSSNMQSDTLSLVALVPTSGAIQGAFGTLTRRHRMLSIHSVHRSSRLQAATVPLDFLLITSQTAASATTHSQHIRRHSIQHDSHYTALFTSGHTSHLSDARAVYGRFCAIPQVTIARWFRLRGW